MAFRIGSSGGGSDRGKGGGALILGPLLFLGSFALHWWNEGDAVKQFKTIDDLESATVAVEDGSIDPGLEGQAVYHWSDAETEDELGDEAFDVREVALRLRRVAEMYQWEQQRKEDDNGNVTYSYDAVWSERHIDSENFRSDRQNPTSMPYQTKKWRAGLVTFGAVRVLPKFLVEDLNEFVSLDLEDAEPEIEGLKRSGGGFYLGEDPAAPAIGDQRIQFEVVSPQAVSLIAAQQGESFGRWTSPGTGREIHKIMHGVKTQDEIISLLVTEERTRLWLTRLGATVMMFFGLLVLAAPLVWLARWVPVLGSVVESGMLFFALFSSLVLSLGTIMVAWIVHRPVVGGSLVVVMVALTWLAVKRVRTKGGGGQPALANAGGGPTEPPPVGYRK